MKVEDYIEKYLNNTASEEEKKVVDAWFEQQQASGSHPAYDRNEVSYAMWMQIEAAVNRNKPSVPARVFTLGALVRAAVFIGAVALLGIGYYKWHSRKAAELARNSLEWVQQKAATNGGFIALQQHQLLSLEQLTDSNPVVIGNLSFRKEGDNILIKSLVQKVSDTSGISIITPKGKFINVTLPDNTVVKLNVASELRIAQNYLQHRNLQLSGEAFFNVVHNEKYPLRVHVRNAIVEDIGTRFNIQAYEGQTAQVVTTVVEGVARVISLNSRGNEVIDARTVTANQQAIVLPHSTPVAVVNNADEIKSAVAWEQGYFLFYNADIKNILQRVGDWYNVKFVAADTIKGAFSGGLSRAADLKSLLQVLETTGNCHFEIISPNEIKVENTGK